jgi:DtxR family Mn-dependent transcriptional regulator
LEENRKKEEYLETLWHMHERGQSSLQSFKELLGADFDGKLVSELASEKFILVDETAGTIGFASRGEESGRRLIRAHRLAERLISDVLGREAEQSACEFEHIVNPELVDGICTLLGHPRECPHGMAIPEGECCRRSATSAESTVVPVTLLEVGQSAIIAYVQCKNDSQMHKLEDLQIRPGVEIILHQTYPSYVIECEGSSIAFDQDVASRIRVWRPVRGHENHQEEHHNRRGRRWRRK